MELRKEKTYITHLKFSVTDFHFESPSQGTMELDIESKVGPSVEREELTNDYIDYKGAAEEDDYIDYSGF